MTNTPLDIGHRRELFVDDYLVECLEGAALRLHSPVRREVVFTVREPLENACTGCYNLVRTNDGIHLYYRGYYPLGESFADSAESQTANLAVSRDGVEFERPNLGLVEFGGSMDNNIVYRGYEAHNFCVFRDDNPAAAGDQQYKAVGGSAENRLYGFGSPDGIHWSRIQDDPLDITGAFDSVNVPMWDPHTECYRLVSRYFEGESKARIRAIQTCTSDDFLHWSRPEPHRYADGIPLEHFYTNATVPCPGAEHLLVSFPMRFLPQRERHTEGMDYPSGGLSDAVFITSRDGLHWNRTFMEAWLRPGLDARNWTHRNSTPAVGILETSPSEWSMYASEHYGWDDNQLRRLTLRPHGFASIHGGYPGGEVVTRPLVHPGGDLRLNCATSAAGDVCVEIQDDSGSPIPGYGLDDVVPFYGDELDAPVAWKGGSASRLRGRVVRLRFALKDADVYAMRFD